MNLATRSISSIFGSPPAVVQWGSLLSELFIFFISSPSAFRFRFGRSTNSPSLVRLSSSFPALSKRHFADASRSRRCHFAMNRTTPFSTLPCHSSTYFVLFLLLLPPPSLLSYRRTQGPLVGNVSSCARAPSVPRSPLQGSKHDAVQKSAVSHAHGESCED